MQWGKRNLLLNSTSLSSSPSGVLGYQEGRWKEGGGEDRNGCLNSCVSSYGRWPCGRDSHFIITLMEDLSLSQTLLLAFSFLHSQCITWLQVLTPSQSRRPSYFGYELIAQAMLPSTMFFWPIWNSHITLTFKHHEIPCDFPSFTSYLPFVFRLWEGRSSSHTKEWDDNLESYKQFFGGPLAGLGRCILILLPPSMIKNISSPD